MNKKIVISLFLTLILATNAFSYDGTIFKNIQLLGKLEPNEQDIKELVYRKVSPTFPKGTKEYTFQIVADERDFFVHVLTYHEEQANVLGKSESFISFWEKQSDGGYICRGSKLFKLYDISVQANADTLIITGKKQGYSDEYLHYAFKVGFTKLFYYYIIELRYKPNDKEPYRIDRSKEDYAALKALPIEGNTRKQNLTLSDSVSFQGDNVSKKSKLNSNSDNKNDNKSKVDSKKLDNDSKNKGSIYESDGLQKDTVHYLYKWYDHMKQISIDMHEPE